MYNVTGDDGRGTFKYLIENAIVVDNTFSSITSPASLSRLSYEQFPALATCHIYVIGTRPRVVAIPESIKSSAESFQVTFRKQGTDAEVEAEFRNDLGAECRLVAMEGGYRLAFVSDGEVHSETPAALALGMLLSNPTGEPRGPIDEEFLDLDVMYVGQSYGTDGDRSALTRLANHETLQKVLADLNEVDSGMQVWVALLGFNAHSAYSFFGPWVGSETEEKSIAHMQASQGAELNMAEITNLAEAALIRYFQPPYNDRYKRHFPLEKHRTYRTSYDLDVNAVGFSLNTRGCLCRFKSASVAASWDHVGLYPLRQASERRAIFDVFDKVPGFVIRREDRPSS